MEASRGDASGEPGVEHRDTPGIPPEPTSPDDTTPAGSQNRFDRADVLAPLRGRPGGAESPELQAMIDQGLESEVAPFSEADWTALRHLARQGRPKGRK